MKLFRDSAGTWHFPVRTGHGQLTGRSMLYLLILKRWQFGFAFPSSWLGHVVR